MARTAMSEKELRRVEVMARVGSGELQLGDAAVLLQVSYRQAKRLARRCREGGPAALRHGSAGRFSNRGKPPQLHQQVLALGINAMLFRAPLEGIMWEVKRMAMRRRLLALILMGVAAPAIQAQLNCGAGTSAPSTSLACLTVVSRTPFGLSPASPLQPTTGLSVQDSLATLSSDIGAEVSQIPLASPASGIIYANNSTTQLPERLNQSFGPILTQRAQTIGRHNRYFATTYQYFLLEDIDGHALKSPPTLTILLNSQNNPTSGPPDYVGLANADIQLKIHQFVGYMTYGLASRVDVSVAVPLLRVDLRETTSEIFLHDPNSSCPSSGCPDFSLQASRAGEATGVGDVVLATKVNVWKLRRSDVDHGGLSLGVEFRLPSGDSHNFLGSGAFGSKPFATFSYAGRYSPHFNVGYQFNGKTDLISVPSFSTGTVVKGTLPNRLIYSGGLDLALFKRLTVNVDGIAQRVFDASRTTVLPAGTSIFGFTTVSPVLQHVTASYTRADAAGGIKWNPFGGLLVSGNISVKLNRAGLRARLVPLMGASYTF